MRQVVWDYYDNKRCAAGCGKDLNFDEYEMGHITSKTLGGDDKIDNLCILCKACNRSMSGASVKEYAKARGYKHLLTKVKRKGLMIYKDDDELEMKTRSDLQRLCKYNGILANQSSEDMKSALYILMQGRRPDKDVHKITINIEDDRETFCQRTRWGKYLIIAVMLIITLFIVAMFVLYRVRS